MILMNREMTHTLQVGSDLSSLSNKIVRERLERRFHQNLADRKLFIKQQVDLYLETHASVTL